MGNAVIRLAEQVILREPAVRPEAEWIQRQADRLASSEGIRGRAETDRLIFRTMYGRTPEKKDTVKIRSHASGDPA